MSRQLACCSVVVCAFAGPAAADVLEQPSGAAIPSAMGCDSGQPTGLAATFACTCDGGGACNIGPTCTAPGPCPIPTGACETTLWHEPNDNTCIPSHLGGLDPYSDGSLVPETFEPTCPLTFTLLTRGTARFQDVFGWYNVGAPEQRFPMLDCTAGPGTTVTLDVRTDPRWTGGAIGFFIATPEQHGATGQCAAGDCCATVERLATGVGYAFYSQRALNADAAGAESVIHLIVYDSVVQERKFYFAWEDIAGGSNNDFTDIVTSVAGVECSGGGAACDTGQPGLCQYGLTTCRASAIECAQVYDAGPEGCDGADNDCDGTIDEGVCDDDVTAHCTGITCPEGEICRFGSCIDPCANVQCAAGEACISGVCLAGCNQCNGAVCPATKTCDLDSGACIGGDSGGDDDSGDGDGDGAGDGDPGKASAGCCDAGGTPSGSLALAAIASAILAPAWARRRRRRRA